MEGLSAWVPSLTELTDTGMPLGLASVLVPGIMAMLMVTSSPVSGSGPVSRKPKMSLKLEQV